MFTKMYFKYFTHKSENEITSVDIFWTKLFKNLQNSHLFAARK